jgi:hypothetical protein
MRLLWSWDWKITIGVKMCFIGLGKQRNTLGILTRNGQLYLSSTGMVVSPHVP